MRPQVLRFRVPWLSTQSVARHLRCLTPFGPQFICPLLNLRPCHVSRSYKRAHKELQTFYWTSGNGQSIVGNRTSTSGTPAVTAFKTTLNTVNWTQKDGARLAVTVRGSIENSRGAHRTRQHTLEGVSDQSRHTVAAHNHFHQVQGAPMRMQYFSEGKTWQLPRTGRTGSPERRHRRHSIFSRSG